MMTSKWYYLLFLILLAHQSGCSDEISEEKKDSSDLAGSDTIIILPCPYSGHYHQVSMPVIASYAPIVPAPAPATPYYEESTYATTTEYYEPPTTTEYYEPPTTTTEYYEPPTTKETYYYKPITPQYRARMPERYTTRQPYYSSGLKPTEKPYRRYYTTPTPRVVRPSFVERPRNNYNNFKTFKPVSDYNTFSFSRQHFPPNYRATTLTHYYETPIYTREYDAQLREPITTTTEYYVEPITEAPYVEPEPEIIEPSPPAEVYIQPTPCNCNSVISEPVIVVEEPEPEPAVISDLPCDNKEEPVPVYYTSTTPEPVYYETESPVVSYQPELPCDKDTKKTEDYSVPNVYYDGDSTTKATTYSSYDSPLTTYSQSSTDYEPKVETPSLYRPVIGYTANYGFPGPYLSMAYGYGYPPNVQQNQPCTTCQHQPFLVMLPMWYQGATPVTPNNVIPPAYGVYSYDNKVIPPIYSPSNSYDNNKPAYGKYPDSYAITSNQSEASVTASETNYNAMMTKESPAISLISSAGGNQEVSLQTLFYPRKQIALNVPQGFTPFLPSPFLIETLNQ